ncbi:hypothetical protein GR927_28410 [Mycolicibacterium sp. 3033]|nr:hypothetical protein [Mycolicibacterium aurantiacum]
MSSATTASEDFRSVVLRSRNVASFKFALAKSVLSLAEVGKTSVPLEELAVPFSQELCAHIKDVDTQSTSSGGRFLDACRHYNQGIINHDDLVATTALLGFNNVIDAFHVVGTGDVETRFFHDERQQSLHGIRFTDELLALGSDADAKEPLETLGWTDAHIGQTGTSGNVVPWLPLVPIGSQEQRPATGSLVPSPLRGNQEAEPLHH